LILAVGKMVHDAVAARALLASGCARLSRQLVAPQGGTWIIRIGLFEALCQHRGVLDRLHRALRHVGEHRVRRIAHQRHAPDGPMRERVAIVKRPTIGRINRADNLADLGMPSLEFLERVGHFAPGGPRLDAPFAGSNRDPVQVARAFANKIMNEVMVRAPPHGSPDLDPEVCHPRCRNQSAISHVSRKAWRLRTHDAVAHRRVNTVGANDHVSIRGRAAMEMDFDMVPALGQSHASMVEMHHAGRHRRGENIEQFGAVEVIIGSAEVTLAGVGQGLASEHAAVIPAADDGRARPHSHAAHRLLESEALEDSRRVGTYLDAGADLAQL
jgi:hypothetical protein